MNLTLHEPLPPAPEIATTFAASVKSRYVSPQRFNSGMVSSRNQVVCWRKAERNLRREASEVMFLALRSNSI